MNLLIHSAPRQIAGYFLAIINQMIVIDVEASGVSPEKNSLVSLGAVDFANPQNRFYEECRIWDGAHIEKGALEVNGFTREQITDPKKKTDREVVTDFWLGLKKLKIKPSPVTTRLLTETFYRLLHIVII